MSEMAAWLVVWPIAIPLIGASLAIALWGRPNAQSAIGLIAITLQLVASLALLGHVWTNGPVAMSMGGWPAPFGIAMAADTLGAGLTAAASAVALAILVYGLGATDIEHRRAGIIPLLLALVMGVAGAFLTADIFNLYVWFEITLISSFGLMVLGGRREQLDGAVKYAFLNLLATTLLLIAIALLYGMTGTLSMADLSGKVAALPTDAPIETIALLFLVSLGMKSALFPLHFWLVPAYAHAPSAVSALMAATATKVSVYVLIRLVFGVFGIDFPGLADAVGLLVLTLGIAGAFVGTLAAILETDLKKLFAQSSIAQLGYMAIGIGAMSATGLAAAFIHLFNHALMKAALFLAIGAIAAQVGRASMGTIQGAGRQIPLTMTAILVGGLALIGVPLTAGFISKLYLVRALLEQDFWLLAALTFISSALALAYVWKIIEAAWLKERPKGAPVLVETPVHYVPAWLMVIATIGFGIFASPLVDAAYAAAHVFIGGAR